MKIRNGFVANSHPRSAQYGRARKKQFLISFGMVVAAAVFAAFAAAADSPRVMRVLPGEYAKDGSGLTRALPAAWGLHFRKGEMIGWKRAWLRVIAEKAGTVSVTVNRVFEPVGPDRANREGNRVVAPTTAPVKPGVNWVCAPFEGRAELRFEVTCDASAACDLVILVKEEAFDPAKLDAAALSEIPYRAPRHELADLLFERNPLMPVREYAEAVARAFGYKKLPERKPMWDEHGAALRHGKPYFPLMMFHSTFNADEKLLAETPLNLYPDKIPSEPSRYERLLHSNALSGKDRSYTEFFEAARGQSAAWPLQHNGIMYLFDEPDATYDPIGLSRLNELFKVVVPETPTATCFCTFATPWESYRASDYVAFDHYPIGRLEPWFSVEAIGWIVDKCRWASGNAPVFFTVQTMDQNRVCPFEGGKPNPAEGFPTDRELTAMTFLPIAHGARGLYFYNFRDIHGDKPLTLPQAHPGGWEQLKRLLNLIRDMEPALIGPEVHLPWKDEGEAKVRLLVSANRRDAYLLAVNSTLHDVTETLAPKQGFLLAGAAYEPLLGYGVKPKFLRDGKVILEMEELGSILWRVTGADFTKLVKKTTAEVLEELRPRALEDPHTDEATRLGRRGQKRPLAD